MKYLNKLYEHIHCFNRKMSSFKISLWENVVFVNSMIQPSETETKYLISMLVPFIKSRRINLCRRSADTIKTLVDRLSIRIYQAQSKTKMSDVKMNNISMQVNEVTVPDNTTCCEVFEKSGSNITVQIMDEVYTVLVNAPVISEMKLGIPPYKGFMLYPYALDKGYNVSILDSKFTWYRIDSKNVIEVGNQMTYTPTEKDVNCCLKLVCNPYNEKGFTGPTAEVVSSKVVDNTIDIYPFEKRLKEKPCNSIRVVSYNILAKEYTKTKEAKHTMYPYCSAEILSSNYRNPLLLKELVAYKADLFCLQEVESKFFSQVLSPLLKHLMGLNGEFLSKSKKKTEGLCCFYSPNTFTFLKKFNIKLNDITTIEMYCGPIIKNIVQDEFWKQGLEKKTIFQAVVLKLISDSNQIFLVCNTHLISDPEGDSIRLFQALIELTIINKIKKNIYDEYPDCKISVIFCGDFNSTPESGVFDLVTKSMFPNEHSEIQILKDLKNCLDLKFCSAYDTDVSYSNYTQTFSGLLDYIYFTGQHLELIQVLPMPLHDDVIKHIGLPSVLFPSDHLALVADLKLK